MRKCRAVPSTAHRVGDFLGHRAAEEVAELEFILRDKEICVLNFSQVIILYASIEYVC